MAQIIFQTSDEMKERFVAAVHAHPDFTNVSHALRAFMTLVIENHENPANQPKGELAMLPRDHPLYEPGD